MLSGVKFVPRDKVLKPSNSGGSDEKSSRKRKDLKKKKHKSGRRKKREEYSSDSGSDSDSDSSSGSPRGQRKKIDGDDGGVVDRDIVRKEMGLEWMLGSSRSTSKKVVDSEPDKPHTEEEEIKSNPRELNPYFRDNGSGYPDEKPTSIGGGGGHPVSASVVGDGGASWRLKALKRAKEQAAREGRKLDEVVEERWGSLGQLAASVASRRVAPTHAHLRAIKDRKMEQMESTETETCAAVKGGAEASRRNRRDYLQDVSSRHPEMKKPKQDSFQWRNNRQKISSEDRSLISSAVSTLNKFSNDGSFMDSISRRQDNDAHVSNSSLKEKREIKHQRETDMDTSEIRTSDEKFSVDTQGLSANQLAAKILQLRMKGKIAEAEKLSKEMEAMSDQHTVGSKLIEQVSEVQINRSIQKKISSDKKKREEDADLHLAQKIMQNKKYSLSERADDEYDFDGDAPSRKRKRKREGVHDEQKIIPRRMLTQQERCQFCFENPSRPKHLVVAIGNFTYMMLPQWQPVVHGHCCILPMQHEPSCRTLDKNVLEEVRNFKKCLLRMFAEQDKDVMFVETFIDLGRQRRHCMIECIPVPREVANLAPMYFKKAIDEAEDEWGQHEMKKVIPTSGNLRNVIPENLAYFHVEFGLDRGFVHVIDDDSNFPSSFGLNVIRGLLQLPEEDMHRRRRQEMPEKQKQAVASFAKEWEPFDWTKDLD